MSKVPTPTSPAFAFLRPADVGWELGTVFLGSPTKRVRTVTLRGRGLCRASTFLHGRLHVRAMPGSLKHRPTHGGAPPLWVGVLMCTEQVRYAPGSRGLKASG